MSEAPPTDRTPHHRPAPRAADAAAGTVARDDWQAVFRAVHAAFSGSMPSRREDADEGPAPGAALADLTERIERLNYRQLGACATCRDSRCRRWRRCVAAHCHRRSGLALRAPARGDDGSAQT